MDSPHSDWLRQLAKDGHGGQRLPSIARGMAYNLVIDVPLDASADAFSGSLRVAPDLGTPVVFAVSVGTYADGITPVTFSLTQAQVNALPPDDDADGLVEMVVDILHTPLGGSQVRFLGGNIFISGKVTDGA